MKSLILRFCCLSVCVLSLMQAHAQPSAAKRPPARAASVDSPSAPAISKDPMTPSVSSAAKPFIDPLQVIEHTLPNGLKLFMSVNKLEPRIMTNIAVRAGSKYDPAETTGLAHYLEHMLFKGTSKIGALNWEEESKMLQTISDLYEQYRKTTDPEMRTAIYHQIDSVSNAAATLVAANEYDKMVSALGAKATNAYTWVEQTVYVNDIPANELERWMKLESERFQMVVLRLFHTELEAVYEEFNINADRDFRKVFKALSEEMFPTHPYGTQTTIGRGEHLKNPSHVNIQNFFNSYYVPNNMAIVLSGDFDPAVAIKWAEQYFGGYKAKPVNRPTFKPQPALTEVHRRTINGQESPWVQIGWRLDGASTEDRLMADLIGGILYNQQAGLIDLNLVQQQKVLEASSWTWDYEDYGAVGMQGKPREGQSLEEVEKLLLEQVAMLRRGQFPEWLPASVVKDYKLSQTRGYENNNARVGAMTDAFVLGLPWMQYISANERLSNITREQIIRFANEKLRDNNYVVVYKQNAEDKNNTKVEKPAITPLKLNREVETKFAADLMSTQTPSVAPVFLDFDKQISSVEVGNLKLDYSHNAINNTFSLYYIFEMGSNADPILGMALNYLPYLGTDKYTPEALQQEFYKLGLSFQVFSGEERSYVFLSGLDESFEQGVKLFEHVLNNVVPNEKAFNNLIDDMMVQRTNAKKDKRVILRSAMMSYARYGKLSSFTDRLTEEQLRALKPDQLVSFIRNLEGFNHRLYYYGSQPMDKVAGVLKNDHKVPSALRPAMPNKQYPELEMPENRVVFVNFPMVQAEILMVSKGTPTFSAEEYIMSDIYNTYFGAGLSSIVFQEIRESKALAYSANAYYGSPSKADRAHYYQAYVGTQADKMPDAVKAMRAIVDEMPVANDQIANARTSILKRIESERITRTSVYFTKLSNEDRGIKGDIRQDLYKRISAVTPEQLVEFQQKHVKGRPFTILVLGNKDNVDMKFLESLGPVEELTLEQVFGY